eukprot:1063810-Pyramimonas_sp.AAC.1
MSPRELFVPVEADEPRMPFKLHWTCDQLILMNNTSLVRPRTFGRPSGPVAPATSKTSGIAPPHSTIPN